MNPDEFVVEFYAPGGRKVYVGDGPRGRCVTAVDEGGSSISVAWASGVTVYTRRLPGQEHRAVPWAQEHSDLLTQAIDALGRHVRRAREALSQRGEARP